MTNSFDMFSVLLILIVVDVGLTMINLIVLGLAVKLYTDQKKQGILKGLKK